MAWRYVIVFLVMGVWGCATGSTPPGEQPLAAPKGTKPAAAAAIKHGNQQFALGRFERARAQYREALEVDSTSAEAHYNLALTLDRLGQPSSARKHYLKAANLAPGNKVIWNSPPLRRHGDVLDEIDPGVQPMTPPPMPGAGGGGKGF